MSQQSKTVEPPSKPLVVAFDFDETLYNQTADGYEPNRAVLGLLHEFHAQGVRVVVVTARHEPGKEPKSKFYEKVKQGKLPRVDDFLDKNVDFDIDVYYTNQNLKVDTLLELGVFIFIDDNEIERLSAQQEGIMAYDPRDIV